MTDGQRETFQYLKKELEAAKARLVAISKTHPAADIQAYYDLGQRDFGENRVGELIEKAAALPADIRWHFIGHLQRNKVKDIIETVHLIHSVDSERLLLEVNKQALKAGRTVDVLLQFHIAKESSKYGLDYVEAKNMLDSHDLNSLSGIRIVGVMGMATYTDEDEQIAAEFDQLADIFARLKKAYFAEITSFQEISMGMSGDYPLALQRGSTMVRVGSLLFGDRNYG